MSVNVRSIVLAQLSANTEHFRVRNWIVALGLSFIPVAEALAQSATNVATVALDAFGERVGTEQIGLYSEQSVRGFSLQDSGNYRLDGAYFIRSANIVPLTMGGTTIRVGINALGVDFPAPSGIVEYRLATAEPGFKGEFEATRSDYGGSAWLLKGSSATQDGKLGAVYGTHIRDETSFDGKKRYSRHYVFVPTWTPNEKVQLRGFFSGDRHYRVGGDYGIVLSGTQLPDALPLHKRYRPDNWGYYSQWQFGGGIIGRYNVSDRVAIQSSFIWTQIERYRQDLVTYTINAAGLGTANMVRGRPNDASSKAVETRAHWRVTDNQRLFGTLRWRQSDNTTRPGTSLNLGTFNMHEGLDPNIPEPAPLTDAPSTYEETRQVMGGLGYEAEFLDTFWARGAVLKTRYEKDRTAPALATTSNVSTPWLYDFAATFTPSDNLTLFATTVKGLEESGVAPNNADNRNEVLPAVLATQYELGMRYRFSSNITLISSLFQIEKPTPGLDTVNIYRLVGEARHRGLEVSLVGRPTPSINIVSGFVLLEADRLGDLIDRGILMGRAVGVPKLTALLNVTYQVPFMKGFSIDAQVNSQTNMLMNPRNGVTTPGYTTLDLGFRYAFAISPKVPATLRVRVGNVFDNDTWLANRNETLARIGPRAFRLQLAASFDSTK